MHSSVLWRRLAGGATAFLVAAGGVLAASATAQAQQAAEPQAAFMDVCDATYVFFTSDLDLEWSVRVDGTDHWPQDGDQQPAAGELGIVSVPSDAALIKVSYQGHTSDWPKEHSWSDPGGECDILPDVTFSQPTCDEAGKITIPDFGVDWLLDGAPVDPGSVHAVQPGAHVVEILGLYAIHRLIEGWDDEPLELVGSRWEIDMEAPDCPDEGEDAAGGGDGGGELADTGPATGLLAGIAAGLVFLGGALYVAGRRRTRHVA